MKYYIDLVWVRMVKEVMGRQRKSMKGMDEILEVPGAGEKGLNVLVEGEKMKEKLLVFSMFCLTSTRLTNFFPFFSS